MWTEVVAIAAVLATACVSANVGLGGGLIHLPLLVLLYGDRSPTSIVPTSLLVSLATLAPSLALHARRGLVRWRIGLALGVPMALGATLGARLALGAGADAARWLFGGLLLVLAVRILRPPARDGRDDARRDAARLPLVLGGAGALGAGLLTGTASVGGGLVVLPLLERGLGLETRVAAGTAAATLSCAALAATATWATVRHDGIPGALTAALALAALVGSWAGARVGLARLRAAHVRLAFAGFLLLAAVQSIANAL